MASPETMVMRAAAKVDMTRTVQPFFMQPAGYINRHDRRAIASAKRQGKQVRNVSPAVLHTIEVQALINAKRAAMIESEAPT